MAMRTSINWGVFGIFGLLIVGFVVAGFLVPEDAKTDDGHSLKYFFWIMAGMYLLTNGIILLWVRLSNRRRELRERTWLDAQAVILSVEETGTYINDQPRLAFHLQVHSPMHPPLEVIHRQVVPLLALAGYQPGATITVKVNPENPKDIQLN
jgi:hypothetical protein